MQIYSDKIATNLKTNAIIAHPVHSVLLNFTVSKRRYLLNNGFTLVGFLPVGTGDSIEEDNDEESGRCNHGNDAYTSGALPLKECIPPTSRTTGREQKMEILHKSLRQVVQPLVTACTNRFTTNGKNGEEWICFPTIVSYLSYILEGRDVIGIMHGTMVRKPCIRCMISSEDIRRLVRSDARKMMDTYQKRLELVRVSEDNPKDTPGVIEEKKKMVLKESLIAPWHTLFKNL